MNLKGFDALAGHIPELNSTSGKIKIAAYFMVVFAFTTTYFILTDPIPAWAFDSQIVVLSLGYLWLSRFFTQKKKYIERYNLMAYRNALLRFALPGLAIVFACAAHLAYMNGPKFTQPIFTSILTWLGWICIIIGVSLWIRAAITFGFDNVAMLYVYFPNGNIVTASIYSIIRHPVYGAVFRICIGLACLNQGIYALMFIFLLPLFIFGWLRLVEEKELIERIPSYTEYRKQVPAFLPYPNRVIDFFKFILTGK